MYKYTASLKIMIQTGDVEVDPNCNGWTVINKGNLPISVNGIELLPPPAAGVSGESVGVSGNLGEVYIGRIYILFQEADTNKTALVIQKSYLPIQ